MQTGNHMAVALLVSSRLASCLFCVGLMAWYTDDAFKKLIWPWCISYSTPSEIHVAIPLPYWFLYLFIPFLASHYLHLVGSYDVFNASAPGHGLAEGMCEGYVFVWSATPLAFSLIFCMDLVTHAPNCLLVIAAVASCFFHCAPFCLVYFVSINGNSSILLQWRLSHSPRCEILNRQGLEKSLGLNFCQISGLSLAHVSVFAFGVRPLAAAPFLRIAIR